MRSREDRVIGRGCRPVPPYRVESPQVRTKSAVVDPRAGRRFLAGLGTGCEAQMTGFVIPEPDVADELAESTDSGQRREEDGDSARAGNTSQAEASDR